MRNKPELLDQLVNAVRSGRKYSQISPDFVRGLAQKELSHRRSYKEALKATKNKLHQVAGAYLETQPNYAQWLERLRAAQASAQPAQLKQVCRDLMAFHASTRERLPILETFYAQTLAYLGPIHSLLDLACGLNPLTLPWLPLAPQAQLLACDIYLDQIDFINQFYAHCGLSGTAFPCDLAAGAPPQPVQLALLLKTIPCLEQVDKSAGERLLSTIQADHILVSFPAKSLGGRSKGMLQNYEARFRQLIAGQSWQVQRFEFSTELAFLINK